MVDKKLLDMIADALIEILGPLAERVTALEKQVKQVRFRGTYQRAEHYEKGNLVTHRGSMWSALTDGPGMPGEDREGWQLAVKSGEAPK